MCVRVCVYVCMYMCPCVGGCGWVWVDVDVWVWMWVWVGVGVDVGGWVDGVFVHVWLYCKGAIVCVSNLCDF